MSESSEQNSDNIQSDGQRKPVLLALTGLLVVVAIVVLVVLIPTFSRIGTRGATRRAVCKSNLKQIALALDTYHDNHGSFPPAYVADKSGRPLYSWRVLILPYIDEKPIYELYHRDEALDSPHNLPLSKLVLELFRCPTDEGDAVGASTNYVAVVGPNAAWTGDKPVSKKGITDGLDRTILIVEVADATIGWAEPRDLELNQFPRQLNPQHESGISSHHKDCAQVAFCDGRVIALKHDLPAGTLRRLLERNDGEPVGKFDD